VAATWTAAANATGYRTTLVRGGVTLVSASVTTPAWNTSVSAAPGTATLSVRAVFGHRQGAVSSTAVVLADVTAPTGAYSAVWNNDTGQATLTQDLLTDDSAVSQVTRSVDWDGPTGPLTPVSWPTGTTTLSHTYPLSAARYVPTVTLADAAHNQTVVDAQAIVINDATAPAGTFTAGPATAWATLTTVTVTQSALADNWSPPDMISRSVDWGDGTTSSDWSVTGTISHVYAAAGTFTPMITLTDEAGNPAQVAGSAVVVSADTVAPVTKLLLPRAKHSVKAWKTLRGKTTDPAGTGVKAVTLRAVQKRGTTWYAYKATTRTWVKAATKGKAFAKSGALTVRPNSRHLWAGKLIGLRTGTLVYRVGATDNVGNTSAAITHSAKLTQR
jgi:hypothetical protein